MRLTSDAFDDGQPIPKRYTADGDDVSPPLAWDDPPDGTRSFALIVTDPDAPTPEPYVHWVLYGLPGDARSLPEGLPRGARAEGEARQGVNSFPDDNQGYRGPAPPKGHGVHHYHFRLYALNREFDLDPGLHKDSLLAAIGNAAIAEAEIVGTYER